jgi:hypothetical protein
VYSGLFHSHKCINGINKLKSLYWTKSSKTIDRCYRTEKGDTCLLHLCSTSFLCSFGVGKYFLVRKLYQETEGICSHSKVARFEICEVKG